jgi:phage/plasmid-associated DNA primase
MRNRGVKDELEMDPLAAVEKQTAYNRYKDWCTRNGYQAVALVNFGKQMLRMPGVGGRRKRNAGEKDRPRLYTGVSFRSTYDRADSKLCAH